VARSGGRIEKGSWFGGFLYDSPALQHSILNFIYLLWALINFNYCICIGHGSVVVFKLYGVIASR